MTKSVDEMTKDDLALYALDKHGAALDLTRPLKELRLEVANLDAGKTVKAAPVAAKRPSHLKHPVTGVVYVATDLLLARGDLLPCKAKLDKDNQLVEVS